MAERPSGNRPDVIPRVKIGPALPDRNSIDIEIARLRDLDAGALRARWQTVFQRRPPSHLPRHLMFRMLAFRLQADLLGDLDNQCRRLLDSAATPETAGRRAVENGRVTAELRSGTILTREWKGAMHRVAVLGDGFGSDGGAARWAVVASLIATAKLNDVEPFAYLRDVLERMSDGHPMSRLDDLLPWNRTQIRAAA